MLGGPLSFGLWLAEQRRKAGLTMRDLAKKCGLSAPYIATLERNTSEPPPLKTCKALGRALGLSWEEVWERSFAGRLRRWLKREGYRSIPEPELLDLLKKIQSANRPHTRWANQRNNVRAQQP
jgi:transcriptional regulator with XRE-family HTH domain